MMSAFLTNHCLQESEADGGSIIDQGTLASCECKDLFFEDGRTDYAHNDHAGDN